MINLSDRRPALFERLAKNQLRGLVQLARDSDVYPFGYVSAASEGPTFAGLDGHTLLNFGSNNYLGLTHHPKVVEAAVAAVRQFGTGCTGSRLLNGTLDLHRQLEAELADFYDKPAALVTTTGFAANTATLTTLTQPGDWLICDHDIHASLLEGAAAAGVKLSRFRHNDARSAQRRVDAVPKGAATMILTEGVFSVDGSVAPLAEIGALARSVGAVFMVDEAHGLGVLGATGRGACEALNCIDAVDLITVTFSKSLASCGGAVVGPADVIDDLRHLARSYLFTASNVPASVGAALAALRVLREQPELAAAARANGERLRRAAAEAGWRVAPGEGPIVGLRVPNVIEAVHAWKRLMDRGVYCNVFAGPAMPEGRAMLRLSAMVSHTDVHFEQLEEALQMNRPAVSQGGTR